MRNTTLELNYYYRPQRSCGKVMFLHVSVILFTGVGGACMVGGHVWQGVCMAGGCVAKGGGMHGTGGMRGRRDGHCSGQYASYWNAFLSKIKVQIFFSENCSFGQRKKQHRIYRFKSILTKLK